MILKLFVLLIFVAPLSAVSQKTSLSSILTEIDFQEDSVKAVFDWVTQNISYEVELIEQESTANSTNEIIDHVLTSKAGVCQHYAELFNALVSEIGYEAYVISGYTKDRNVLANQTHAWNAVKISQGWFLYDPTWSSGYVDKDKFVRKVDALWYRVKPEEFIYTHVPFDPKWQFLTYPVTAKLDNINVPSKRYFNYEDSIRLYTGVMNLRSVDNEIYRVKRYSDSNPLVSNHLHYLGKLKRYYQIDNAIDLLNEATSYFNLYTDSKNRAFRNPKRSVEDVKELLLMSKDNLKEIRVLIEAQHVKYKLLEESEWELKVAYKELRQVLEQELLFMKKYEKTWPPLRIFRFLTLKKQA